ncbi:YciI family protein [Devosia sp. 2618]|uniref:YciI family protein n=1 Tax=Devosia sp. 2618 TaxID=3156454 RepID=UPI0033934454
MKFITFVTTTNPAEAGAPPPALMEAIVQLGMEAGARMVETGGMSDTATVKVRGKQLITDGPFTEAKEMVGGYAIYDLPTEAEIISWTERFADLHRQHWPAWEGEIAIKQLHNFSMPG